MAPVSPVTPQPRRRMADGSYLPAEPSNAEIMGRIDELSSRLDGWVADHRQDHAALERSLAGCQTAAVLRQRSIDDLERLRPEVASLHDWRIEMQSMGRFVKAAFGASLLSALLAMLSLVDMIAKNR